MPRLFPRLARVAFGLFGELVAPSGCAACDAGVAPDVLFCPACAVSLLRVDADADVGYRDTSGSIAAFEYGGALATAIARLKYQDRADLAPRLGRLMLSAAPFIERIHRVDRIDRLVPVPLHPKRLADRGYNHAALLAAPIARALSVRVAPRALLRLRDTPRQATLDRAERLVNVRDAFIVRPSQEPLVRGASVLLIDDVRTTGATLDACTRALHDAGARAVTSLVLARRP